MMKHEAKTWPIQRNKIKACDQKKRDMCTQSVRGKEMEIQASTLAFQDILGLLGTDTKRLLKSLRQHLDTTFCSYHVSVSTGLKTERRPQAGQDIPVFSLSWFHMCTKMGVLTRHTSTPLCLPASHKNLTLTAL